MTTTLQLATAEANVTPVRHPTRGGISLMMGTSEVPLISPVWTLAGWRLQFVRLLPEQSLRLDRSQGEPYVKVILGSTATPARRAYPQVGEVTSTKLIGDTVVAGADGALISIFTATNAAPNLLSAVDQLRITGPFAHTLTWQSFEARFGKLTPFFNGVDAHMVPGFHLLDGNGAEIAYVHFWIAGKGVDLSTHDHGNTPSELAPAFAEVHQVLNKGTGSGGMYRTEAPGAAERTRLPMQRGEEHGPFFLIDPASGRAKLRENGAVAYPWHGWQAGNDSKPGQSYDLVCAYEITAPYSFVN